MGRQIAEAGRRAWAWVVQQWNTWLKGAVAGLLAAIVVIGLIALAVLGGLITLPVAVIAGILVLVATIGVGIWQQMQGKGF
jgi:predicted lipid-binding transport protein (Tim44 family)